MFIAKGKQPFKYTLVMWVKFVDGKTNTWRQWRYYESFDNIKAAKAACMRFEQYNGGSQNARAKWEHCLPEDVDTYSHKNDPKEWSPNDMVV